jgi:murein hydrolase activator
MRFTVLIVLLSLIAGCSSSPDLSMSGQRKGGEAISSHSNTTVHPLFTHPLPWPVTGGTVVKEFGEQTHAQLGTVTENPGIDIAVPHGTQVRSVASGRISLIDDIPGFGNVVIVEHDNAAFSVYGKLSVIHLKQGDTVQAEQVIADSGEGLHFEIWHKQQKQDPLPLLEVR